MADEQATTMTLSEPPQVKVIAARGAALQTVIAQLSEFAGLLAITYALCLGKLSEQTFGYLFCVCLGGRTAEKLGSAIRGKPVQLPAATLIGVATALVLTFAPGCARSSYEPDWVLVHNTANAMRTEVAKLVEKAKPAKPAIELFCQVVPSSPQCDQARAIYDAASAAVEAFNGAVDVYEQVGVGAERVESAINAVYAAMQALERQTAALTEAMHAVLENADQPGSPAPTKSAAPAPGRSAPVPAGRGKPAPAPAPAQGPAASPAGNAP